MFANRRHDCILPVPALELLDLWAGVHPRGPTLRHDFNHALYAPWLSLHGYILAEGWLKKQQPTRAGALAWCLTAFLFAEIPDRLSSLPGVLVTG